MTLPADSFVPRHVAVIMDGNGRWAEQRGLSRTAGHKKGAEALKKLLPYMRDKGVSYVTLYAFSTENWKRPPEEVRTLMDLFRSYLDGDIAELKKQGVRVSFIGQRDRFPADLAAKMTTLENETRNLSGFHVVLALSYGGRDDLVQAVRRLAARVLGGEINIDNLDTAAIAGALSTAGIPDPDLIIRTSGEQRISNFLLWESAYSEYYFPKVFWPDFTPAEFDKALAEYALRHRRYGGL